MNQNATSSRCEYGITGNVFPQNVSTLDLESNAIRSLETITIASLSKLRVLNLAKNRIARLPEDIFMDTSALQELQIGYDGEEAVKFGSSQAQLPISEDMDIKVQYYWSGEWEDTILDYSYL